jgi:uncharacterized protein (DUF2062 family)
VLFRRRNQPALGERVRIFFLPRRNYGRSLKYYGKRVLRLSASPHSVAAGVACGVAASCTPFIGFHFILAFVVAFLIRGNMLAAALGTAVGNPLTFPFIWLVDFRIGSWIQNFWQDGPVRPPPPRLAEGILEHGWDAIRPLIEPMVIGAIPFGIACGLVFYTIVRVSLTSYQKNRRERLAEKRSQAGVQIE